MNNSIIAWRDPHEGRFIVHVVILQHCGATYRNTTSTHDLCPLVPRVREAATLPAACVAIAASRPGLPRPLGLRARAHRADRGPCAPAAALAAALAAPAAASAAALADRGGKLWRLHVTSLDPKQQSTVLERFYWKLKCTRSCRTPTRH